MANPTGHTYHVGEHHPREEGGVRLVYKDPDWEARTPRVGTPSGARRLAPAATSLIHRHPLLALAGAFVAGSVVSRLVGACCSHSHD